MDMDEVEQGEGLALDLQQCKGLYLPPMITNIEERLQKTQDLKYKEGDVIVTSYPKTGTHWITELVYMVLHGKLEHPDQTSLYFEFTPNFELIESNPSPRLLGTHFPFRFLPAEHKQKKGKLIHLLRNPKDTMVSLYHFLQEAKSTQYKGTWEEFFNIFSTEKVPYGNYIDCIKEWEEVHNGNPEYEILAVFYEDLHKDCLKELRRISKYLGVERSDSLLREIAEECRMDKLKETVMKDPVHKKIFQLLSTDNTPIFYRKGAVGDWKNHLTVAQNGVYNRMLAERLGNSIFKFDYVLNG